MKKSNHKNFVETYWRNRSNLINNIILPHQNKIFNLLSKKFKSDANKDWERNRMKLKLLWYKCANKCDEIYKILDIWNNTTDNTNLEDIVNNIVNMDYESVEKLFNHLKENYKDNPEIYNSIQEICDNLAEMRKLSKKYTNIIHQ